MQTDASQLRESLTKTARELLENGKVLCYSELYDLIAPQINEIAQETKLPPALIALCLVDDIEADLDETGVECDKNGFLRCHDLLVKLVDRSSPMPFRSDGVVIPLEVWQDVLREVEVVSE